MENQEPISITTWNNLPAEQEAAVRKVVDEWEGTPYRDLTRIKGMGVDCFQLVAAMLDELNGKPTGYTVLPKLSPSIARHRPDLAKKAIMMLVRAHSGCDLIFDGSLEPGDVVAVRSCIEEDGHLFEGHAMIVTDQKWSLLQACRPETCRTSCEDKQVVRVYRPRGKESWS